VTKRLGMFLGLGFAGALLLLTGLAWDALAHANDPTLAGREGIFTLSNPGHSLMGLGIGLVLVSLIGGCDTLLSSGAGGRWGRPGVRRAFLTASTAMVVLAAAVTSWAAGQDHGAGSHTTAAAAAAAVAGHGHDVSGPAVAGADGPAAAGGHDHGAAVGDDGPATGAGGHAGHDGQVAGADGPAAAGGHDHSSVATSVVHDHVASGPAAAAGVAAHDHGPAAPAGQGGQSAGSGGHDHDGTGGSDPSAGAAGDHHHDGAADAAPPVTDAPQGTWTEMRYGPFVIPPAGAGGDANHADIAVPTLARPCSNCFLLQLQPDLIFSDGSPANLDSGMMLHHAVLFSAGRQDATCGPDEPFPGKLGQRFFASGNERTQGLFPPGFGYYVDSGNWSGIFHIMNHGTEPQTVYFKLDVRWSPASAGGIRPLTPLWLDMNNCRTSEYAVPAGPSSSHWTWTSNVTGRIVSTGGHVHNGGIRTTLTNRTTDRHLCTSWAYWGRDPAYQGSIEQMSVCAWDRIGTVRRGEVLDLETVYDAPQPVPDAMGIMMAFVYETDDLAAGTDAPPTVKGETRPPVDSLPPPPSSHHH